jgi:Fur family transcriptional regulator, ferric uptake regulator
VVAHAHAGPTTADAPGARATKQKRAIVELLDQTTEFTSAQDLHTRLRTGGERVGLTTVYSQLRSLADAGAVDTLRADNGEVLYRRCQSASHHHHLVCRRCGRAVEIDAPDVETLARRLGTRHGFRDLSHVLEITGVCNRCAA